MARRKRNNKLSITYKGGSARIVYVPRAPEELLGEARRIYGAVSIALRHLKQLRRTRHAAISAAVWQLQQISAPKPDAPIASLVDYISNVSFIMGDTLDILSQLRSSKVDELEAARFQLTYGQTPKKRDRDDTMCAKSRRYTEAVLTDD